MIIHGSNQVNEKVRRRLCTTTVWTLLFQKMMVVAATDLRWLSMKLPPPSDAAIHEDEELTTTLALKFASGGGNGTLEEKNKNIFIFS